jgi:hypothetical protein
VLQVAASGISFWSLSSSDAYPLTSPSKEGPASCYATSGIALRALGILKPPHHDKVEKWFVLT